MSNKTGQLSQFETNQSYRFGDYELDAAERVLRRNGEIVSLPLKPFEVLLVLVERRGRVVSKEELIERVWPDSFVDEANLARHVYTLRRALGESHKENGGEDHFIQTVSGRGYRFVASVRELDEEGTERVIQDRPAASVDAIADARPVLSATLLMREIKLRKRGVAAVLAALLVGVAAIIFFAAPLIRQRSQTGQAPLQRKLSRLTYDTGLQSEPTWSPDGNMIAYSSDRSGNFDIWVQPVSEGNPVRVTTSSAHDWQPDWSPDGARLAFRSERDGGGLFVVPALGGAERKIAGFGCRPRWSPDGSRILFYSSTLQNVVGVPKVYLVELDGKPPRELAPGFLGEFNYLRAVWHPDGQRISLWGSHLKRPHLGWSFWTITLSSGATVKSEISAQVEQQLKTSVRFKDFSSFLWAPSGQALYFEGSYGGVRNLWRVEVEPQTLRWIAGPERLTTDPGPDTEIAISPDGKKLAYTIRTERTRIWSLPFNVTTGRIKGAGQPVTSADKDAWKLDLSRDGRKLVFAASRAGREELWEKSLEDGRETLLRPADDLTRYSPRWSRDGLRLVYRRDRGTDPEARFEFSIVRTPAGGGDEQLVTFPSRFDEFAYDWSADGEWILGNSERHSPGRYLISLFPLRAAPHAEDQMRVVTSHKEYSLWQPRFSPDERWICFNALKATEAGVSTIYVVPSSGGDWTRITEGRHWEGKARWSPDGKTIYFVSNRTGFFNVWGIRFDPRTGKPVGEAFRVTEFESPGRMVLPLLGRLEMALAADRLVLPIMEVSGSIWVLENVDR